MPDSRRTNCYDEMTAVGVCWFLGEILVMKHIVRLFLIFLLLGANVSCSTTWQRFLQGVCL